MIDLKNSELASAIPQALLDELIEASDRYSQRVEELLKQLPEGYKPDIHGVEYAMGQLSGLHIAMACMEIDDEYMEFEGDDDSPIKFKGISRYYEFEEPDAECTEVRTSGDGTRWERLMGESWERCMERPYLVAAFQKWRDRIQEIAQGKEDV